MSDDPKLLVPKFKSAFENQSSPAEVTPDAIRNIHEIIGSNKTWSFKYVTNAQVSQVIRDAAAKKSCGEDNIPMYFLKKIGPAIAINICQLVNMIISSQHYPQTLATAKCTPIWKKKGKKSDHLAYRKIGMVSCIAKIVDTCLFSQQMADNIERILPNNLFAYRKGLGTEDAILHTREKVAELASRGLKVAILNLDIRKAFDSIPHQLIVEGVKMSGATIATTNIVKSYLSNQTQFL